MKKLFKMLGIILALLIVLIVVAYLCINIIAKTAITKITPQITGTAVELGYIDLALLNGKIELAGFKIGNPTDFSNNGALQFNKVTVLFDPASIFSKEIVVKNVTVDGTQITAELNTKGQINLTTLNNNINNYLNAGTKPAMPATQAAPTPAKTSNDKTVALKELAITNSAINLVVFNQKQTIALPNITHKDDGSRRNIKETIAMIMNKITLDSLNAVKTQGSKLLESGYATAKDMAKNAASQAKTAVKGATDAAKTTAKGVTDTAKGVGDTAKSIGSDIKGIFKK